MSTTVALALPWGQYHANPWGSHVNEGSVEWPPSPWRLLRALYAMWRNRAPHLPAEAVERVLNHLSTPPVYAVPPFTEATTRHWFPDSHHGLDRAIDAFVVTERDAVLGITWPADLEDADRVILAELLELLSYVGRAESVCEARLLPPHAEVEGRHCRPVVESQLAALDQSTLSVLVPQLPLKVEALTASTIEVRRAGFVQPPGSRWQRYERPTPMAHVAAPSPPPPQASAPKAAVWAIEARSRPALTSAVAVTDALRRACVSNHDDGRNGGPSQILAGKDANGRRLEGHGHAHYLALPGDHDSRKVGRLVVWALDGLGAPERAALARLTALKGQHLAHAGLRPMRLGLEGLGPVEAVAPWLVGPAQHWRSLTPFAPPRHARRQQEWADHLQQQVSEELARRNLPAPRAVEVTPGSWLAFRRHRIRERLEDGRRATGLRIAFDHDVAGPLALGALSHFGLGLFVPER